MRSLAVDQVGIRDFRNLEEIDVALVGGLNVVHGDNGHGKTSLLEAIYLATCSKSFRTARLGEVVRHDRPHASVRLTLREAGPADASPLEREQTAGVSGGRLTLRIDGHRPGTRAAFATRTPVVVFHPEELSLSTGAAALRRRLLDRLVLYRDPLGADALSRHTEALRSRQDLLRRGHRGGAALDAYEEICAEAGARVVRARAEAARALAPHLADAFLHIAEPGLRLEATFRSGGAEDAEHARRCLHEARERDAHRASAGFGPHRDDLDLRLGGRAARTVASQGQHRAIVLSLKAAESDVVAEATGRVPLLLLDDVSSELDPSRTDALFRFLGGQGQPSAPQRQILLTTTRPELVPAALSEGRPRSELHLVAGRLQEPRSGAK